MFMSSGTNLNSSTYYKWEIRKGELFVHEPLWQCFSAIFVHRNYKKKKQSLLHITAFSASPLWCICHWCCLSMHFKFPRWFFFPGGLNSKEQSLGQEDPLEKGMATHSSVLAWRIPGAGEPGGLPSMGSHRAGHDWSDSAAASLGSPFLLSPSSYPLPPFSFFLFSSFTRKIIFTVNTINSIRL